MDDSELTSADELFLGRLRSAPDGPRVWHTSTDSTLALGRRLQRRRSVGLGGSGLALAVVVVSATVALASGSERPTIVTADGATDAGGTSCVVPGSSGGKDPVWLSGSGSLDTEATLRRLQEALDERFGVTSIGGSAALRFGLIGQTTDQTSEQVVVVVGNPRIDRTELQQFLAERAGQMPGAPADWLSVRLGCHHVDELVAAEKFIDDRTWKVAQSGVGYAVDLDARTSTFHITIPEGAAADRLRERLGDLVTLEYSTVVDRTARDDAARDLADDSDQPGGVPTQELSARYDRCVRNEGFDPGGVQVLIWQAEDAANSPPGAPQAAVGSPWWVKTGRDVPAEIHRPCLRAIGGADPHGSSHGNDRSDAGA